jgi:hypothetical protein
MFGGSLREGPVERSSLSGEDGPGEVLRAAGNGFGGQRRPLRQAHKALHDVTIAEKDSGRYGVFTPCRTCGAKPSMKSAWTHWHWFHRVPIFNGEARDAVECVPTCEETIQGGADLRSAGSRSLWLRVAARPKGQAGGLATGRPEVCPTSCTRIVTLRGSDLLAGTARYVCRGMNPSPPGRGEGSPPPRRRKNHEPHPLRRAAPHFFSTPSLLMVRTGRACPRSGDSSMG